MNPEEKDELLRILEDRNIPFPDDWVREAIEDGAPSRDKALFLREVWSVVLRESNVDWLEQSIAELSSRIGQNDIYSIRFRPENPELLSALVELRRSAVPIEPLTHVIRQGQIHAIEWVLSLIDGGHCFGDGLAGRWGMFGVDENSNATSPFGDMKDVYWLFNPDRKDG